ncbi:glycerate kinase type-2 family protein [Silvibacterium acidisoli]|uniref:glycerate kinase type-2 family protein n=1 Tax=Acidobacteriaceae bacterium ZG23-2 TaxID=2883246 RepID=UPI00406C4CA4
MEKRETTTCNIGEQGRERKAFLRELFQQTMQAVALGPALRTQVSVQNGELLFGPERFSLASFRRVFVVAIGKAATPMADHLHEILAPVVNDSLTVEGVVVGTAPWHPYPGWRFFNGSHPLPTDSSFDAAELLLEKMEEADEQTLVLFLVSGGASSMLDASSDPTISREEMIEFHRLLVLAGLPIEKMNVLRKHLSSVKGGRLAAAGRRASQATLLISDVPPGMLHVVGSGVSLADPSTIEDCRRILAETPALTAALPEKVASFFAERVTETPKQIYTPHHSLLSSESLTEAAAKIAEAAGYRVIVDNSCDDLDYREAAKYLADRILKAQAPGARICLMTAGEVTVSVSGTVGLGGRNQQWLLEIARLLQVGDERFTFLSAGSDGIDGNSPAAGAVATSQTWACAVTAGVDPARSLAEFDAYTLFEKLGDTIVTGPLGNNLRDLRVILADFPA